MEPFVTATGVGTVIEVWVVPGSSRTRVVGRYGDALKVTVSAPPEAGRANRAVTELLARTLGAEVHLVAGETDRRKRVEVALAPSEVVDRLGL